MAVSVVVELSEGDEKENGESGHRCEENGKLYTVNKNDNGILDGHTKENGKPSEENVYIIKENGELPEENERNNLLLSGQNEENAGQFFKENVNPYKENGEKSDDAQLCGVIINSLVSFVLVVRSLKVSKLWSERKPQQELGQLLPLSPVQIQV